MCYRPVIRELVTCWLASARTHKSRLINWANTSARVESRFSFAGGFSCPRAAGEINSRAGSSRLAGTRVRWLPFRSLGFPLLDSRALSSVRPVTDASRRERGPTAHGRDLHLALVSRSRAIFSAAMKNRSNLHWVPSRIAICQVSYDTPRGRDVSLACVATRTTVPLLAARSGFSLLLLISKHNSGWGRVLRF